MASQNAVTGISSACVILIAGLLLLEHILHVAHLFHGSLDGFLCIGQPANLVGSSVRDAPRLALRFLEVVHLTLLLCR